MLEEENLDISYNGETFVGDLLKRKRFEDCLFIDCKFLESDLSFSRFLSCKFQDCDFTNPKTIATAMPDCAFEKSKVLGVKFTQFDTKIFKVSFIDCNMELCDFQEMNLVKTVFSKSVVKECDFYRANLTAANFEDTNLEDSIFEESNLSKTNFVNATNYLIDPLSSKLKGAKFSTPEVLSLLRNFDIKID